MLNHDRSKQLNNWFEPIAMGSANGVRQCPKNGISNTSRFSVKNEARAGVNFKIFTVVGKEYHVK
jgi:hypothetical protein